MDKSCLFLFHLSTGDNFTMYAAVRHFQKIYKDVFIFCLYRNRYTIKQLFQPYNNIHIHIILDENHNNCLAPEQLINQYKFKLHNCDLFESGFYVADFDGRNGFWEQFYNQLNLPYKIRYDFEDINRNKERELTLYNSIVSVYGKNYIFLHDHRNIKYKHNNERGNVYVDSDFPVFHPNFNYYHQSENNYKDLWNSEFLSDNLLDYCTLIENATEIYISDSAFCCLMPFLDLQNVKKKCIHTDYDLESYHEKFKSWEIIRR
jgi:hypothetical protein